jgi:nucleoside phosphorylase
MAFNQLMTDTIAIIKTDGRRFDGVKASVQAKLIMTMNVSNPIEAGDVIERALPNGVTERFEIVEASFQEKFHSIPAHYSLTFRRVHAALPPRAPQPVLVPDTAKDARVDVALITMLDEEFRAVLACLEHREHVPGTAAEPNIYSWERGIVRTSKGDYSVVVAFAGNSTTSIGAVVTQRTVEKFHPRYVVLVGVAGGFPDEGLAHGDVVVSKVIYGYEYGKVDGGFRPRPDFTYQVDLGVANAAMAFHATGSDWWSAIPAAPPSPKATFQVRAGAVASGDKVVDDVGDPFFSAVLRAWPKLLAVEMEGAGAAAAIESAKAMGKDVGLAMVRGISDMPGSGHGKADRDAWKLFAAHAAAQFLFSVLRNRWPVPPLSVAVQSAPPVPTVANPPASPSRLECIVHEPTDRGIAREHQVISLVDITRIRGGRADVVEVELNGRWLVIEARFDDFKVLWESATGRPS